MALTGKQMRNGIPDPPAGQNTAVSGPMEEEAIVSEIGTAEAAAGKTLAQAHALMSSPQGSGVDGHAVGTQGSTFAWDSGLAIDDVEGGGSD